MTQIDIWEIPSKERIFRSLGGEERGVDGRGESKTGEISCYVFRKLYIDSIEACVCL